VLEQSDRFEHRRRAVVEILGALRHRPAVPAMLRILENKGHLRHELDGNRYLYLPTLPMHRASRSALRNVLETFFEGSTEKAVAALLDLSRDELSDEDLERLSRLIGEARKEER